MRQVAGSILKLMKLELHARLRERDGAIVLDLSGVDAPLLLDNEGETLEALQHVLNRILSRDSRFGMRLQRLRSANTPSPYQP